MHDSRREEEKKVNGKRKANHNNWLCSGEISFENCEQINELNTQDLSHIYDNQMRQWTVNDHLTMITRCEWKKKKNSEPLAFGLNAIHRETCTDTPTKLQNIAKYPEFLLAYPCELMIECAMCIYTSCNSKCNRMCHNKMRLHIIFFSFVVVIGV